MLATLLTFLVLGAVVAISNNYTLETMCRLRALDELNRNDLYDEIEDMVSLSESSRFYLPTSRKYELN